jgi:hypothetical protein
VRSLENFHLHVGAGSDNTLAVALVTLGTCIFARLNLFKKVTSEGRQYSCAQVLEAPATGRCLRVRSHREPGCGSMSSGTCMGPVQVAWCEALALSFWLAH